MHSRPQERNLSIIKGATWSSVEGQIPFWRTSKAFECAQMAQVGINWYWHLWVDLKDSITLEAIDCQDRGSSGERRFDSRKGKALHWIEEYSCKAEWSRSHWKISSLLVITKGAFKVAQRNDCWN